MAEPEVEPIRVLICDDHPIVREGLRTFLGSREGIEVVGDAASGEEALRKAPHMRPDIVLMDLVMPGIGGVEATRQLQDTAPGTRVIVLTSVTSDDEVLPAVRAGAVGYLLKDADPSHLEEAVRAAHRGESVVHPRAAARILASVVDGEEDPVSDAIASLTVREREVLDHLAEGRTNRQIARAMGIAEKTVKTHVTNVLAKLGAADRTQAAIVAVRAGLGGDTAGGRS